MTPATLFCYMLAFGLGLIAIALCLAVIVIGAFFVRGLIK